MTLACYSTLLIGLCHKKNIKNFGGLCCPLPLGTPAKTKPQPTFTSPLTCLRSPVHVSIRSAPSVASDYSIVSIGCSAFLFTHHSTPPLPLSMSSCHVIMSLTNRHVISSYIFIYIYKLNTISFG